jgi:hypothetical protein
MAFSAAQAAFLQRLVSQRPAVRRGGGYALFFSEHYCLGAPLGNRVEYTDVHFLMAERLLRAHDLPVTPLGPGATRADSAAYGGMSEKDFSSAPHAKSVAVKSLGRCLLGGHELFAPEGAYVVLTPEQASEVTCNRLMLVENLETFRRLEAYTWIGRGELDVLAIYRGDPELANKDVAEVVLGRREPLWGFADFDPAGLGIVNSLPTDRLERVVLPSKSWLETAADTPRGRQLFDRQVRQYAPSLDGAGHPEIVSAWALMKRLRSAVAQERMVHVE